jgi:pimeloyl-ACP methyl ester carboxylesterase
MSTTTSRRVARVGISVLACFGLVTGVAGAASAHTGDSSGTARASQHKAKPTVVLVHGAFADASGWSAEVRFLTRHGYPVIAPAVPLRGLLSDASYILSLIHI